MNSETRKCTDCGSFDVHGPTHDFGGIICVDCGCVIKEDVFVMPEKKVVSFSVKKTDHGATVTKTIGDHKRAKRFRNGYANAMVTAGVWIHEQIESYKHSCAVDGVPLPLFEVHGMDLPKRRRSKSEMLVLIRSLSAALGELATFCQIANHHEDLCQEADELLEGYSE